MFFIGYAAILLRTLVVSMGQLLLGMPELSTTSSCQRHNVQLIGLIRILCL